MVRASTRRTALLGLLVLAVVAAHGVALLVPFQFDDAVIFAGNRTWTEPLTALRAFVDPWLATPAGNVFYFRPLTFATYVLDGSLGGGAPWTFRVTSLAVLVAFAAAAGQLARQVLAGLFPAAPPERARRAGVLAALAVAVHPVLDEAVLQAWSRSSLLMGALVLAALARAGAPGSGRGRAAQVAGLTVLALLAKETAVVAAPLALLLSWTAWPPASAGKRLRRTLPVLVPIAAWVSAWLLMGAADAWPPPRAPLPHDSLASALAAHVSLEVRPLHGLMALARLARLVALPVGLSPVHEITVGARAWTGLASLAWLAVLAAGAWTVRRAGATRAVGLALLWFVLALAPIVLAGLNTPAAEHRAGIALVLPVALLAWALTSPRWPPAARRLVPAALLVLLAGVATWEGLAWRDPLVLWSREVRRQPESVRAWSFLALAQEKAADLDHARASMQRALELAPDNVAGLEQAARLELLGGSLADAGRLAARGLALEPGHVGLLLIDAEALARSGRLDEALERATTATTLSPGSSAAWNALGNVRLLARRADAVDAYRRAVELDPRNDAARRNLAMAAGPGPR